MDIYFSYDIIIISNKYRNNHFLISLTRVIDYTEISSALVEVKNSSTALVTGRSGRKSLLAEDLVCYFKIVPNL